MSVRPAPARSLLHAPVSLVLAVSLLGPWPLAPQPAEGPAAVDPAAEPIVVDPLAPFEEPPSQATAEPDAAAASQPSQSGPRPAALPISRYTVQAGDSLAAIAERFGLDVPTLIGSNEIDDPDLIPPGRELAILPVVGVLYEVREGDSLLAIALRYGVEARKILDANGLENPEIVVLGQELIVPDARPLYTGRPAAGANAEEPAEAPSEQRPRPSDDGPTTLAALNIGPPTGQTGLGMVWPAGGPITTHFGAVGWASPRGHAGLDIAAPWGAPVLAAGAGRVLLSTRAGGPYGYQIIIDHGAGLRTVYGHLSELLVESGEPVARGELVGRIGSTGFSTGPHLHFEVRQDGALRNPLTYLP